MLVEALQAEQGERPDRSTSRAVLRVACATQRAPRQAYLRDSAMIRSGMPCALSTGQEAQTMLFTIAVILLVLWLLGLVSGYTLGNFIYVLLVIALVLFVAGIVSGRRTV
jgi:hypothetical protein